VSIKKKSKGRPSAWHHQRSNEENRTTGSWSFSVSEFGTNCGYLAEEPRKRSLIDPGDSRRRAWQTDTERLHLIQETAYNSKGEWAKWVVRGKRNSRGMIFTFIRAVDDSYKFGRNAKRESGQEFHSARGPKRISQKTNRRKQIEGGGAIGRAGKRDGSLRFTLFKR